MVREGHETTQKFLSDAHKMTRNNTLNKYKICLERQPHKVAVNVCGALQLTEKITLLKVEGACAPVPYISQRQ